MKKYRVVEDYQGGEFGMGRDYTALEWLEQAMEWRDSDDSWGEYGDGKDGYEDTREYFESFWKRLIDEGREQELIEYISDIWELRFEEVDEEKVMISKKLRDRIYNYLSRELEIDNTCVELNDLLDGLDREKGEVC